MMKVLVADDDPITRRMLEGLLRRWGWQTEVATDGAAAMAVMKKEDGPRLVILDWIMPEMDGVEVCRELRHKEREPYVYVLLLTAKREKEEIIKGFDAGVDDYLTKPFDPDELDARLRAGRRIIELQDKLIEARNTLHEQAIRDGLTGIWNRKEILEILGRELIRARRSQGSVGVVMADLDHFKSVNDTYGHLAGDMVLVEAARRMRSAIRAYDAIGRYGGEEFLIVLPGCDQQTVVNKAEQLRTVIGAEFIGTSDVKLKITASFGAFSTEGSPDDDPRTILRLADEALYRAKEKGRNRVEAGIPDATQRPSTPATPSAPG